MRKLALEKAVVKDLLELPPKQYRQVVSAVFDLLTEPQPHYAKALRGSPYVRIAVGEYRIVYRVDAECVYVVVAGKRNDSEVYSRLGRKQ
jgi:mRNA interferase RelE/StbE